MSTPKRRFPDGSSILRDVQLHAQPHILVRPARKAGHLADASSLQDAGRGPMAQDAEIARIREQAFEAGRLEAERELRADTQAARARAMEEGRLEGLEKGLEQARDQIEQSCEQAAKEVRAEVRARIERIDLLAERLRAEVDGHVAAAEEDMVALAFEALCRVLGEEAVRPQAVRAMVRQLSARHSQEQQWSVHVHPDDFTSLRACEGADADVWHWVPDETVQMGGVVLRSAQSSLDARLEIQVQRLRDTLIAERTRRRQER